MTAKQTVLKNFFRTKFITSVYQIDFLAGTGKKNCIFHSHIPASYYCNCPFLEKGRITGCTIGNSHTTQFFLSGNSKMTVCRSTGYDYRLCMIFILFGPDHLDLSLVCNRKNWLSLWFQSKFFCMTCHRLTQIQSGDSRKSRIIVYFICVHDLSALHKFSVQPDCI